MQGEFCLPPSEAPTFEAGMSAARDAEFRDAWNLPEDEELDDHGSRPGVSWADAFVRMASEANDALDPTLARTGYRGERNQIVLHHDVNPDGTLGPGQLHTGDVIPDTIARFLACDAQVRVAAYEAGRLLGITPTVRTPSRALRRPSSDATRAACTRCAAAPGGCTSTTCGSGATVGSPCHRTSCACATSTTGSCTKACSPSKAIPKLATLRFIDARGRPIEPPDLGSPEPLRLVEPTPFDAALRRPPRHRFLHLELERSRCCREDETSDQPNGAAYQKVPVTDVVVRSGST